MKLLTLNTHSLMEEKGGEKLLTLVKAVTEMQPDVIALQEVNQSLEMPILKVNTFVNTPSVIRRDNFAAALLHELNKVNIEYHAAWLPIKIGFDRFDEGVALLSRIPILDIDNFLISKCDDYYNWRTRRVLGIRNELGWFYSVHMGWWNDEEEPFKAQWERLNTHLNKKENVWLMGDFNSQADIEGEGYSLITSSDKYDTYLLAKEKDDGVTVEKAIDGWKDKKPQRMRIDYIFTDRPKEIKSSRVIFNGVNYDVVSDHYGITVEV